MRGRITHRPPQLHTTTARHSMAKVLRRAACFACCIVAATRMPTAASTARVLPASPPLSPMPTTQLVYPPQSERHNSTATPKGAGSKTTARVRHAFKIQPTNGFRCLLQRLVYLRGPAAPAPFFVFLCSFPTRMLVVPGRSLTTLAGSLCGRVSNSTEPF